MTRVYQWKFTGCYLAAGCAASGSERSRINNSLLLRDMLVASLGVGALPSFLADPAIARGELRRILPAFMDEPRHVYAVYPTSRHLQPKVKAFVEFSGPLPTFRHERLQLASQSTQAGNQIL